MTVTAHRVCGTLPVSVSPGCRHITNEGESWVVELHGVNSQLCRQAWELGVGRAALPPRPPGRVLPASPSFWRLPAALASLGSELQGWRCCPCPRVLPLPSEKSASHRMQGPAFSGMPSGHQIPAARTLLPDKSTLAGSGCTRIRGPTLSGSACSPRAGTGWTFPRDVLTAPWRQGRLTFPLHGGERGAWGVTRQVARATQLPAEPRPRQVGLAPPVCLREPCTLTSQGLAWSPACRCGARGTRSFQAIRDTAELGGRGAGRRGTGVAVQQVRGLR